MPEKQPFKSIKQRTVLMLISSTWIFAYAIVADVLVDFEISSGMFQKLFIVRNWRLLNEMNEWHKFMNEQKKIRLAHEKWDLSLEFKSTAFFV